MEYRYPDRLGLRFPLAEIVLMGDTEAMTAQTGIELIPIVRAIVKDRADEREYEDY